MNALVGRKAKVNFSLVLLARELCADDCGGQDASDLAGAGRCRHLCRRGEFDVLHDGFQELQPSQMM